MTCTFHALTLIIKYHPTILVPPYSSQLHFLMACCMHNALAKRPELMIAGIPSYTHTRDPSRAGNHIVSM